MIDREAPNPSDLAIHLSRRVRGLPFWFSLATHGTDRYVEAVERTLRTAGRATRGMAGRGVQRPLPGSARRCERHRIDRVNPLDLDVPVMVDGHRAVTDDDIDFPRPPCWRLSWQVLGALPNRSRTRSERSPWASLYPIEVRRCTPTSAGNWDGVALIGHRHAQPGAAVLLAVARWKVTSFGGRVIEETVAVLLPV